jgi:hypothetical protein
MTTLYQPISLDPDGPTTMSASITYAVPPVRGSGGLPAHIIVQNESGSAVQLTGSVNGTDFENFGSSLSDGSLTAIASPPPYLKTDHTVTVNLAD